MKPERKLFDDPELDRIVKEIRKSRAYDKVKLQMIFMSDKERMEMDALELERILKRAEQLHVFEKMRKAKS